MRQRTSSANTQNGLFFKGDLGEINVPSFSPLVSASFQPQKQCVRTVNFLLIRQSGFIRKIRQTRVSDNKVYQHNLDSEAYRSVIFSTSGFQKKQKHLFFFCHHPHCTNQKNVEVIVFLVSL